jgi:hypothetical protein
MIFIKYQNKDLGVKKEDKKGTCLFVIAVITWENH